MRVLAACVAMVLGGVGVVMGQEAAEPGAVEGWVAPAAGEHPRLFFRVADLAGLRARAETPEGRQIVDRLKYLLDGAEGKTLPKARPIGGAAADDDEEDEGGDGTDAKTLTLWHGAGYGMMYQLTGDRAYADLGRAAVEVALKWQQTDLDPRYSFTKLTGALRNGPALSAVAMAYDLCYGGWDELFREKVRKEIEFYDPSKPLGAAKPKNGRLEDLARGSKHNPSSNHWGPQIGGAAIALLAIRGDPGVDAARVEALLATNRLCMVRQLSEGMGDHGYYWEHLGPGQITTDSAFLPALQAWRVAGGVDFAAGRTEAAWATLRWAMLMVPTERGPEYLNPVRIDNYGGQRFSRIGLARGGQFAQGFGLAEKADLGALKWVYERFVEPGEAKWYPGAGLKEGERSFDTVSPYPHRAMFALVNWPFGVPCENPATRLARQVTDERSQYHMFRNRWQDGDDVLVGVLLGATESLNFGDPLRMRVWGYGRRFAADFERVEEKGQLETRKDGSWRLSWPGGAVLVDFAPGGGMDAVVAAEGFEVTPDLPEMRMDEPVGADLTGMWRMMKNGVTVSVERVGAKWMVFGAGRHGGKLAGSELTLNLEGEPRVGKVSGDFLAITWKAGKAWKRPAKAPTLDTPADISGEGYTDVTGVWNAEAENTPDGTIRLVQKGDVVEVERVALGELEAKGARVRCTMSATRRKKQTEMVGVLSGCGNILEFGGAREWRRVGSEAAVPANHGGAGDEKSQLTVIRDGGRVVSVVTFSGGGRHAAPEVKGGELRVGERVYGLGVDARVEARGSGSPAE